EMMQCGLRTQQSVSNKTNCLSFRMASEGCTSPGPVNNPKVLPCLHTFCEKYLQNYTPSRSLTLLYPVCRRTSILPKEGLTALQSNFITGLMEVLETSPCGGQGEEGHGGPHPTNTSTAGRLLSCPSHEGNVMEFYCLPCEMAVCKECTGGEHSQHTTVPLRNKLEQHRLSLQEQLNAVKNRLPEIDSALQVLSETLQQMANQKSSIEQDIHTTFTELQQTLDMRKKVLLMELEVNYGLKQKVLQAQLSSLLQGRESMHDGCTLAERALLRGSGAELLLTSRQLGERLDELAGHYLPLQPEENAQLAFIAETEAVRASIRTLGAVNISVSSVGQTGTPLGEGVQGCVVGRPARMTVTVKEHEPDAAVGRKVKTLGPANVRQRAVKRPGSKYSSGRRKENPIEDDLVFRIGTKGRNKGEFTNLQGVAASNLGKVLIADSNNQCVQIFSNDGQFRNRFGVRGRSPGQLQRPTGVAEHPNGDIIIADYDNKWVSIFSSDGKFKTKIGSGKLMGPKGVSINRNGHVVVVDNKACCVFIFQPNGKLVTKFGSRGNGDKQFAGTSCPHFAAVNQNNEIIITDFHNHSVKVFNSEGEFLLKFGSNGEGNGQFNAPTGVAVDVNGNIIVADWGNSRIQVFDGSGSFLSYINTSADPLYGPQGLALTSDGHVVVADSGNHCFKVYRYLQ
uniref:Tripartite motif-containing protein 2 n=1 Tax=Electrophorus electricus TaxID=8005 RepID=A0A4W4ECW1_ELEEL